MNAALPRRMAALLLALFAALSLLPASALAADPGDTFSEDHQGTTIYYRVLAATPSQVEVVSDPNLTTYKRDVAIPAQVTHEGVDYAVTRVGADAFLLCTFLTSIDIPEGVVNIGESAFQGCAGLKSVIIPKSVRSIGESAFENCQNLPSVNIPEGVVSIGASAFASCKGLTGTVAIPSSVQSIGDLAFMDCSGLTNMTIPATVKSLGTALFQNCTGLKSVTLPKGLTSIPNNMFLGCSSLPSIDIPDTVTSIEGSAFERCGKLDGVLLPASLRTLGASAFQSCGSLGGIKIPNGVSVINDATFAGCGKLAWVEIPNGVQTIGQSAFMGCALLQEVKIPNSVTTIFGQAFQGCTGLKSLFIPASVTRIEFQAFQGCTGLERVVVEAGANAVKIGNAAFNGCANLRSVTLPDNVGNMGSGAFVKTPINDDDLGFTLAVRGDVTVRKSKTSFQLAGAADFTSLIYPITKVVLQAGGRVTNATSDPLAVEVNGTPHTLAPGESLENTLPTPTPMPVPTPAPASAGSYVVGSYPMLSGDGAVWPGFGTLQFTSAGPYSGFQWASVDGAVLPASAYTVTEGSTVLALRAEYLATLAPGAHRLTMQFSGGTSEASFTTGAALVGPPKTGEQAQTWAVLALGALALAGVWGCLRRRKAK